MSTHFRLLSEADTPTVIGKAWWNEALKLSSTGEGRRVIMAVGAGFLALTVGPPMCAVIAGSNDDGDSDNHTTEKKDSLSLQRQYGWSFGVAAEGDRMTIPGAVPNPIVKAELKSMATTLAPTNPLHTPAYVPTLFQSLSEAPLPSVTPTEDVRAAGKQTQLVDIIVPLDSPEMGVGGGAAKTVRTLLKSRIAGVALIVDMPGPAAVAFAAELADAFDPVFLFDNWPHPRGVVPAHLTLAAAAGRLQRFKDMASVRATSAPPLFVLDRNRLAPYTDEQYQFDNRSLSRLPSVEFLKKAGITRVLYVPPPTSVPIALDDVNEDLMVYATEGLSVRAVDVMDYSGLTAEQAAEQFTARYAFPSTPAPPPASPTPSSSWAPQVRASPFTGTGHGHVRPVGFGTAPVVVAVGTGVVLGSVLYRSGSWNRTTSSFGGG